MQWTPFYTLSRPYLALSEFGLIYLAISGSWGPQNSLKLFTAFSYLTSKATHGPVVNSSAIA